MPPKKRTKRISAGLCSPSVLATPVYAKKSKLSDKGKLELIKKEVLKDIALVNVQINQLLMTIGITTKADEAYTMRQQMLDLLRFKYNIIENY